MSKATASTGTVRISASSAFTMAASRGSGWHWRRGPIRQREFGDARFGYSRPRRCQHLSDQVPAVMKTSCAIKPILAISLAAASHWAQAQAFDAVRLFGTPTGDGEGSVGAAVIAGHQYMGSDERRTIVLPVLDYRWKNGWFAGTTNGVGYLFDSAPNVQYGVRLTVDLGRGEGRSTVLAGMGDISARPEIGAFFNYLPTREVFLTSSLRC